MAFHPREFAMDPTILDRIREDTDDQDPLNILISMEDEWITNRDSLDFNRFNQLNQTRTDK